MRAAGFTAAAFFLVTLSQSASAQTTAARSQWTPWIETGAFVSSERSRLETGTWLPLMQSARSVLFLDARGKLFQEDQREGNLALGYRGMLSSGWNLGGWLGFDRRQTAFGTHFNQVAFGFEALHPFWDVRASAYVPIDAERNMSLGQTTSATSSTFSSAQLSGGNVLLLTDAIATTTTTSYFRKELALSGFDGEIGARLPLALPADIGAEFRVYAGGFVFDHQELARAVTGPKMRAELRLNEVLPAWTGSALAIEGQYRWDEVRGHQHEVGLKLRMPFGESGSTARRAMSEQERRMADAIHRDTDIVTHSRTTTIASTTTTTSQTSEKVADALTGVRFDRAVVVQNGTDLQNAASNAGGNSLLIAMGGVSTFSKVALLDNQTLQGGGSTISVRGIESGTVANFTAAGSAPTLKYTVNDAPILTAANNTHFHGLTAIGGGVGNDLNGANNSGFVANGVSNVFLTNSDISKVHGHGAYITNNNTNINIVDTRFTDSDFGGIAFNNGNSINLLRVTFHNSGDAIAGQGNNTLSVNQVTISGTVREDVFNLLNGGNAVSGSNNVLNATSIGGRVCQLQVPSLGGFTGSMSFVDGVVLVEHVAPCN